MPNRNRSVLAPNLGLFLDRPALAIPRGGLSDCLNVRIKDGKIERRAMGWGPFFDDANRVVFPDPVTGMDNFVTRDNLKFLLIATTKDIFEFRPASNDVALLTPRYETGTVSGSGGSTTVTGTGTAWLANVKEGDRIHLGTSGQRDADAEWFDIAAVVSDTELTLTEALSANFNSVDYTIRQTFQGSMVTPWVFEVYVGASNLTVGPDGDRWYATNGVDRIVAWFPGQNQVYRPDLGDLESAVWMRRFKNMMVYGNIRTGGGANPTSIRNSAIGEPENTVTAEAGQFVVHDGVDPLLNGKLLGDNLVVYAEGSVHLVQFIGGDLLFAFRSVISDRGLLATRAVADFGDFHEFLSTDAKYRFDGVTIVEREAQVWRDVIRRLAPDRLPMLNAFFDDVEGDLIWSIPLVSDVDPNNPDAPATAIQPQTALVEHYLERTGPEAPRPATLRQFPALAVSEFEREIALTWQTAEGTWEEQEARWDDRELEAASSQTVFGGKSGALFSLGLLSSQDGEPFVSFARTGRFQAGDIRRKGVIKRIYPQAVAQPGASFDLEVRLHTTEDPSGNTMATSVFAYDLTQAETSNHFVSPRVSARYFEIEFFTDGSARPWQLEGWDVDMSRAGQR